MWRKEFFRSVPHEIPANFHRTRTSSEIGPEGNKKRGDAGAMEDRCW